jgi:hypothetical protein
MNMTHYMELLASAQPWNLIAFMAVPVILAETVAVTELFVLLKRPSAGGVLGLNRAASIAGGVYFTGVFVYLMINAVVPLTAGSQWRGPADVIAMGFYLLGVVPLAGLAALDLGFVGRKLTRDKQLAWHAGLVALFLVVAHVAMIFGMLDPTLLTGAAASHMH